MGHGVYSETSEKRGRARRGYLGVSRKTEIWDVGWEIRHREIADLEMRELVD